MWTGSYGVVAGQSVNSLPWQGIDILTSETALKKGNHDGILDLEFYAEHRSCLSTAKLFGI